MLNLRLSLQNKPRCVLNNVLVNMQMLRWLLMLKLKNQPWILLINTRWLFKDIKTKLNNFQSNMPKQCRVVMQMLKSLLRISSKLMNFVLNTRLRLHRPIRRHLCTPVQWLRLKIEFQLLKIEHLLFKRGKQRDYKNVKLWQMPKEDSKMAVLFNRFLQMVNNAKLSGFQDKHLEMAMVVNSNE